MLSTNPKGLLVYRDELSAWARSMNQYRGGRGGDVEFYQSAWSGTTIKVDRKSRSDAPLVLPHPLLGVLGGIQPDVLHELDAKRGQEDGFLHRVLFACCDHGQFPGWSATEVDESARVAWDQLVRRLMVLEPDCPGEGSYQPKALPLSEGGRAAFARFCERLAQNVNDGTDSPSLIGVAAKMKGYCARFALVIHLLRHAAGDFGQRTEEGQVDHEDVERAVRLCDYFLNHAAVAYRRLRESAVDKQVNRLVAWMRRKKLLRCCARDVIRANVAGIAATSDAEKLIAAAVDRGFGIWDTSTDGKERVRRFVLISGDSTRR
jgi:hypothetical protein